VYGNHDALIQGNLLGLAELDDVATGDDKIVGLPDAVDVARLFYDFLRGDPAALRRVRGGVVRKVTPDPDRRFVDRRQVVREHFVTAGRPDGHGFTADNLASGTAYYGFDAGIVRCLVLDTVNGYGGPNGSLDTTQFGWLERELLAGHRRNAHQRCHRPRLCLGRGRGRWFLRGQHGVADRLAAARTTRRGVGQRQRHVVGFLHHHRHRGPTVLPVAGR
jgi:hypothetical protein